MTAAPILERLEALPKARQVRPGAWVGCCPGHEDDRPSLSWAVGSDGRVLLKCFAGCDYKDVLAAVEASETDLFAPTNGHAAMPTRKIVATYDYTDEAGTLLYQSVRYEPKDFAQRRPDGRGGWVWKLDGVRRVLYRLPDLVAAPGAPVVVVEGEKDADRLASLGILATTNSGGAGKWRPEYADALAGRVVYVIPDNDEPGRRHAQNVGGRIVDLPGLPAKGDVSDWLNAGHDVDELRAAIDAAQPASASDPIDGMDAADLLELDLPPLRWAVTGLLPEGLVLLAAPPKVGKSLLAYQVAVELRMPGGIVLGRLAELRPVMYYALEDGRRRSQARINAVLNGRRLPRGLELRWTAPRLGGELEAEIGEWLALRPDGVVIVDVLSKVRSEAIGKSGQSAYDGDYAELASLHQVSRDHPGTTIVVVTHDRKAGSDDWVTRVTGTRGMTGAADAVIFIDRKRGAELATFYVTGRDMGDEAISASFTGSGWILADIAQVIGAASPTRQAIYAWLAANGPAWQKAIAEATGIDHETVKQRVSDMARDGQIVTLDDRLGYRVPLDA